MKQYNGSVCFVLFFTFKNLIREVIAVIWALNVSPPSFYLMQMQEEWTMLLRLLQGLG